MVLECLDLARVLGEALHDFVLYFFSYWPLPELLFCYACFKFINLEVFVHQNKPVDLLWEYFA